MSRGQKVYAFKQLNKYVEKVNNLPTLNFKILDNRNFFFTI